MKFPATKFLKSISTTCIPNYPDKNLPTVFVYFEGDLKKQLVGPFEFRGMNLTYDGKFKSFGKLSQENKYLDFFLFTSDDAAYYSLNNLFIFQSLNGFLDKQEQ